MTARPQRKTPTTGALLLAMVAAYAAILLPALPRRAGAAASPLPPIRSVAPTRAFIDSWVKAALLAHQATEGVVVEVDAEDTANTIEVDVVRQEGPGRHRRQPGRDRRGEHPDHQPGGPARLGERTDLRQQAISDL